MGNYKAWVPVWRFHWKFGGWCGRMGGVSRKFTFCARVVIMEKYSSALLIASILMIICSPIMAGYGIFASWAVHNAVLGRILWVLVYKSIALLLAGIVGIRNHNKAESTRFCFGIGVFILVWNVFYTLQSISMGIGQNIAAVILGIPIPFWGLMLLNTPIPLWYLIAAYRFRKRAGQVILWEKNYLCGKICG